MQNFLRAGGGGAGGRAERKRECERVNGERAHLLSLHFLRRSGAAAAAAAAKHLQWYTRGLDRPWPRYAPERLLVVLWFVWLVVDSLLPYRCWQ